MIELDDDALSVIHSPSVGIFTDVLSLLEDDPHLLTADQVRGLCSLGIYRDLIGHHQSYTNGTRICALLSQKIGLANDRAR